MKMKDDLNNLLNNIPEGESSENLKLIFNMFLDTDYLQKYDRIELLEFLEELSDKQWHSYNLLESDLFTKIELWLENNYSKNNINEITFVLSICVRLGFNKLYQKMIKKNEWNNHNIDILVKEFTDELGNNVSNPYKSLE